MYNQINNIKVVEFKGRIYNPIATLYGLDKYVFIIKVDYVLENVFELISYTKNKVDKKYHTNLNKEILDVLTNLPLDLLKENIVDGLAGVDIRSGTLVGNTTRQVNHIVDTLLTSLVDKDKSVKVVVRDHKNFGNDFTSNAILLKKVEERLSNHEVELVKEVSGIHTIIYLKK